MERAPLIPDFVLLRRIGGGSYGDVWLGRSVTGVYRAVKVIDRARFEDDRPFFRELSGITRFQQALVDQPRQLALLHVGRNDDAGILYYVMELADDVRSGTSVNPETYVPLTLAELHRTRRILPAADCVRIGAELAEALAELHAAGLLHRDVKPSNVIFVNGRAKLADIGLIASATQTVSMVGTPEYAAPEGPGSPRSDLFSLGKILYELATGRAPHEFPRLPPDLQHRSDAAALMELNDVILRACDPDPATRYPDAAALLSDLRLLQAGRSVQELNRTRRQLRALSWFAALAGLAALLVIAVLGVKNYFALRTLAAQETAFRKAAEDNERLARYTSDLHFAQLALTGGDLGAARTALRRQIPSSSAYDLRGLEWYALWHQAEGDAVRTLGDVGGPPVTAVAVAADGRTAVIIERGTPNRAVLLDLKTGTRKLIAEDCYGLAAFDSTRSRLITTRANLNLEVLDPRTGERSPQGAAGILAERSTDNRRILLATGASPPDMLRLWDVDEGYGQFEWRPGAGMSGAVLARAAASPGGRLLAGSLTWDSGPSRADEVIVRDTQSATDVCHLHAPGPVGALRFSRDGARLAIVTDVVVQLIAPLDPSWTRRIDAGRGFHVVDFSPDGMWLAVGGVDGRLTVWSTTDGANRGTFLGHESAILSVEWMNDGQHVITGGLDGTCRIWAPDQRRLEGTVSGLWSGDLGSVVVSPDGGQIAITGGDGRVVLMNAQTLAPVRIVSGAFHPLTYTDGNDTLLSMSADKRLVRTRVADGSTSATDLELPGESHITAFGVSGNGRFAVFGRESGSSHVWNLKAAADAGWSRRVAEIVRAIAVTNGGDCVALSTEYAAYVTTRASVASLPAGGVHVTSLAFSNDDVLLAAGTDRGEIVIWDWRTRSPVATLRGHTGAVRSLSFTGDGTRLLSGGGDGLVIIWMTHPWRWLTGWICGGTGAPSAHAIYRCSVNGSAHWVAAMTETGELQRWDCRPELWLAAPGEITGATAAGHPAGLPPSL